MLSAIEDRQQQIVNHLKVNQFATVADLIDLVNYSDGQERSCFTGREWIDQANTWRSDDYRQQEN